MPGFMMLSAFALSGRCSYPASLGYPVPGETRAWCDSVTVEPSEAETVITVRQEHDGQWIHFVGAINGQALLPGWAARQKGHSGYNFARTGGPWAWETRLRAVSIGIMRRGHPSQPIMPGIIRAG